MFHRSVQYATRFSSCSHLSWSRGLGLLSKTTALALLGVAAILGLPAKSLAPAQASAVAANAQVQVDYSQLPLYFEANHGQTDQQVQFLARGRGYSLFLTPTEAVLALRQPQAAKPSPRTGHLARAAAMEDHQGSGGAVLRLRLLGANPQPHVVGLEELSGKVHYFRGNDPTQWRTNIPTYAKVK